ncbi:hypothetical protein FS837_011450, partial [Tulasnella sp. UAMH 9824]
LLIRRMAPKSEHAVFDRPVAPLSEMTVHGGASPSSLENTEAQMLAQEHIDAQNI